MDVFGAAGDLGADFETRNGSADLIHPRTYRALVVQRLPHGAAQIDPQQLALVGGGAVRVGEDRSFVGRGIAGARQHRIVGRRALQAPARRAAMRVTFSVAALTTTTGSRIAPSLSANETATPSAGQSSAERDVTFM